MNRQLTAVLTLMLLLVLAPSIRARGHGSRTLVHTRSGLVRGVIEGNLRAFRGLPYAAPPVGSLRWRQPEPVVGWPGIRDASSFGPLCPQITAAGNLTGDEDCLHLNVFTDRSQPDHDQPVMVFFHGGGNARGSASQPSFDKPLLATRGAIVVTAEYRLGILGQFVHPALSAEGGGSSGNYLLMDMIAALRWVRDNIGAFGGDPDRVMVFGQSAGSYETEGLLASPAAQGLFSTAGMESGSIPSGQSMTQADMQAAHAPLAARVGCDGAPDVLACLRAVPALTLVTNQAGIPFNLTIEPRVLPVDPFDMIAQNGLPVPLLIGSNSAENSSAPDPNNPLTAAGYEARIRAYFDAIGPGISDQVLALYPVTNYPTPWDALIDMGSDYDVTCETRTFAMAAARSHRQPVWRYLFTHRFENDPDLSILGPFHRAELFFVFGTLPVATDSDTAYVPTDAEVALSNQMMDYWVRFAAHGNPNGLGAVHWRRYNDESEPILRLDDPLQHLQGYHVAQCNYLQTLPQP
jgi:para-nitrobenzyl esterase